MGAGLGDRETDILKTLKKRTSDLTVELFKAYEPNKETAKHLKQAVEESNNTVRKMFNYQLYMKALQKYILGKSLVLLKESQHSSRALHGGHRLG